MITVNNGRVAIKDSVSTKHIKLSEISYIDERILAPDSADRNEAFDKWAFEVDLVRAYVMLYYTTKEEAEADVAELIKLWYGGCSDDACEDCNCGQI